MGLYVTQEQIETRIKEIETDCIKITQALDESDLRTASPDKRKWYSKARAARAIMRSEQADLKNKLAELKRIERQNVQMSVEQKFIQIARKKIDPDLFAEILMEARG